MTNESQEEPTMSYRPWMFALVIAATLGVVAASSGTASAQVKPPADF